MPASPSLGRRAARSSASFVALATAFFSLTTLRCSSADKPDASADDAGADARPRRDATPDDPIDAADPDATTSIAPTEGAGSRFVPFYVRTELDDGSHGDEFSTFFDMKLNGYCTFEELGTDEWHCMPRMVSGRVLYTDASCTQPTLATGLGSASEKWVEWGNGCERKVAPFTGPTYESRSLYARKSNGACEASSTTQSIDVPEGVPLSTFGTFARSADTTALPFERSGTRLVIERDRLDGTDGSFVIQPPRIVDVQTGKAGRALRADDGQFRFLPAIAETVAFGGLFADSACTRRGVTIPSSGVCHEDPHAPDHFLAPAEGTAHCMPYRAVKSSVTPAVGYYLPQANTCVFEPGTEDAIASLVPEDTLSAIPAATLPLLERTLVPNETTFKSGSLVSVRSYRYTSADGFEMRERDWRVWLSKYDVPCQVAAYGDGSERCAPIAPSVAVHEAFLDSVCTQPIVGTLHGECDFPTPFLMTHSGPNGYATYKRPAETIAVPPTIYIQSSGNCVAYPSSPSSYVYYAAPLEVVSPTEFPKVVSQRIVRPGDL